MNDKALDKWFDLRVNEHRDELNALQWKLNNTVFDELETFQWRGLTVTVWWSKTIRSYSIRALEPDGRNYPIPNDLRARVDLWITSPFRDTMLPSLFLTKLD